MAELNVQVFPTVLTTHSIDSDSAVGVSVITDDKSSSDEEVSGCVYTKNEKGLN